jgi:hypothetical protein
MAKELTVDLSCSFCGKHQRAVRKLIAGPSVYICDECIGLCNDIIAEEIERAAAPKEAAPKAEPSPRLPVKELASQMSSAAESLLVEVSALPERPRTVWQSAELLALTAKLLGSTLEAWTEQSRAIAREQERASRDEAVRAQWASASDRIAAALQCLRDATSAAPRVESRNDGCPGTPSPELAGRGAASPLPGDPGPAIHRGAARRSSACRAGRRGLDRAPR